jgi:hypothetical protein
MNRQPRNYQKYLSVEYAIRHPSRPEKKEFSDELLAAVAFIMRQIDPVGNKPIIVPPMPLEGYVPQLSVRGKGDVEAEG